MSRTGLPPVSKTVNSTLQASDAVVVADVQVDFLPGGALGVPDGDEIIPVLNRCLRYFHKRGLPIYVTRDWHPPDHCSFRQQGGPWPVHCVSGSAGAAFGPDFEIPPSATVISKATRADREAYSAFEGTDLAERLCGLGVKRLVVGGLATDYCVLNTVRDAVRQGYEVLVLRDGIRAVNVQADDGARAIAEMRALGARMVSLADLGIDSGEPEPE